MRIRLGCLSLLAVALLAVALPLLFVGIFNTALLKLHLTPGSAFVVLMAVLLGSLVNVPVRRIRRTEAVFVDYGAVFGLIGVWPRLRRVRRETVVAVNVGGCVVPTGLAIYELGFLLGDGTALAGVAVASAINTGVCYALAQPVRGVGIVMPGLVPPLVAVASALVLAPDQAPAVAFISGVAGPLVGADLLHVRDVTRMSSALMSIGGAGTFDGILLSGVIAAYLA